MDAVIYTRVSKHRPGDPAGRSTDDQERESRQWCEANGHPVEKVFVDQGISASKYTTKTRNAWNELKSYLRPGHILVTWEASRTTRDLGEFVVLRDLCEAHQVPLAYSGRVIDFSDAEDTFVAGLDAVLSERESRKLSARVLRGKRSAALKGTPNGGPPWGYHRVGHAEWDIDPVEAPRVRQAVARLLDGESQYSVIKWLESTGVAPKNLMRTLANPALAGMRVFHGEIVGKASWPALLSEEEHQRLLEVRTSIPNGSGREPRHLLGGIAKCGVCQVGMNYRNNRDRKPAYVCREGHVSRIAELMEEVVVERLFRRLRNINPADYDASDFRALESQREIDELEKDLKEWEEKAIAREVSATLFARIEQDRQKRIAELRPHSHSISRSTVQIDNWDAMPLAEKREAIRAHLNIVVPQYGSGKVPRDQVAIITPR